uniref:Uncharacterized protein n=1 Tax=Anguilla anguilla TaxID=7936 RepID=A0A0E9VUR2_ANGAN
MILRFQKAIVMIIIISLKKVSVLKRAATMNSRPTLLSMRHGSQSCTREDEIAAFQLRSFCQPNPDN